VPEDIAKWSGFDGNGRTPKENAANVALIVQAVNEREALRDALTFIESLAAEELAHVRVGTGAEIALRHIQRRAERALAAPSPEPPAASRLKP
jgi:hypothetical protein